MATSLHLGPLLVPAGPQAFEIDAPTRANGATVRIERMAWPVGDLFTWRVYERERNGSLLLLASSGATPEQGGTFTGRGGVVDPPLVITLRWAADKDRDLIRFEADVTQPFTTELFLDFVA